MSVAFVKKASGQSGAASTTITLTLASAPTSGNMLVFAMAGDKNTGALTLSGFTQLFTLNSTSVSLYFWYKVSNGTETSISPSWASSAATGNVAWYGEFEDSAVSGSTWQISASANHNTDETNVTSWSTGTTGTVSSAGLGLAVITMDSADSVVDGTLAWTNSYASLFITLASAGARGGLHMADLAVSAGGTTETTFSFTASTTLRDQLSGAIAVLTKVVTDVSAPAGQPSAAGAAQDALADISGLPDTPSAAGTGQDAVASLSALPDTPAAAGAGQDASASVSVLPDTPAAAGAGQDASVSVSVLPDTPAAMGTAQNAQAAVSGLLDTPVASGTGQDAAASLSVLPDTPAASGTAYDAVVSGSVSAGQPTAAGTAPDMSVSVSVLPDTPAAAGTAYDASASVSGSTAAFAGAATAAGAAYDAFVSIMANAGFAAATGTAYGPFSPPQLRDEVSGREPGTSLSGSEPVSSLSGAEPPQDFSGREAGHP